MASKNNTFLKFESAHSATNVLSNVLTVTLHVLAFRWWWVGDWLIELETAANFPQLAALPWL